MPPASSLRRRLVLLLLLAVAVVLAWLRRRSKRLLVEPAKQLASAPGVRDDIQPTNPRADGTSAPKHTGGEKHFRLPPPLLKPFAAFVSHFKIEAAMEARFLTAELESALDRNVFLDRSP